MLTDEDIQKLTRIFPTKEDLKNYATQKQLRELSSRDIKKLATVFATKEDLKKFATKEELYQLKDGMYARMDQIMGELKAMREDHLIHQLRSEETHHEFDKRITLLEVRSKSKK